MHNYGKSIAALVLGVAMLPFAQAQDESLDNLARELIRLRNQVESLYSELQRKRENFRTELRSLASQKAELEANKRREELSIQQLEKTLAEKRERARRAGAASEELQPVVMDSIGRLKSGIMTAMPFKRQERINALEELESQLRSGAVTAQRAVNRLWGFYEDELRLTRENGIHSQVIAVEGKEMLVDVARLGTVLMYFRTKDDRYGMAVPGNDEWSFRYAKEGDNARLIRHLFESLQKQIRTGYFALPNPGIPGEVR